VHHYCLVYERWSEPHQIINIAFLPALPEDVPPKDTIKLTSVAAWRSLISTHTFTCPSSSLTGKMA